MKNPFSFQFLLSLLRPLPQVRCFCSSGFFFSDGAVSAVSKISRFPEISTVSKISSVSKLSFVSAVLEVLTVFAVFAVLAVLVFGGSVPAYGWGGGHDTAAKATAENLPSPWRERVLSDTDVRRQFLKDSHYPDSFGELEAERWGEENVKLLNEFGIQNRYGFHSPEGRCAAFHLLVEALRKDDSPRVILLLAILSHSICDQTAFNHEPLVQYATYTLGNEGLKVVPSLNLDLVWLEKEEEARRIWAAKCAELPKEFPSLTPAEAFERLFQCEWTGMSYSFLGVEVLECAYVLDQLRKMEKSPAEGAGTVKFRFSREEAVQKLAGAFAAVGYAGVKETLALFAAAQKLAEAGKSAGWSGKIQDFVPDYAEKSAALIQNRSMEMEGFCVPYLAKKVSAEERLVSAEIQVLYDPTGRWNQGFFGGDDRIYAVQVTETLRRNQYSAELLDVRQFVRSGLPADGKVRLLIVPAQRCVSWQGLKVEDFMRELKEYVGGGGHVLWVGNALPYQVFPELSQKQTRIEKLDRYAKPAYPAEGEEILECGFELLSENGKARSWKFAKYPGGSAGWFWPSGRSHLKEGFGAEIVPTVSFTFPDGRRLPVGFVTGGERPAVGFVPTYILAPYFFTREEAVFSPMELKLDSAGEAVLLDFVRRLKVQVQN